VYFATPSDFFASASEAPDLGLGPFPFTMYGAVQRWPVVGDIVLEESAVMCDV